ncbi:MAG: hypothetical protein JXR05_10860 [Flavobacteriaceae bacterium]
MSENSNKPNPLFWVVGVIALVWNLLGVSAYLMQAYKTESFMEMYDPEQLEIINNMPVWATAAFGIAVFGGALGSLVLLLRKKLASMLFMLSFIGIIVQFIYNFFIANSMEVYGPGALIMPLLTIVIGLFLIVYSKNCVRKGWLS